MVSLYGPVSTFDTCDKAPIINLDDFVASALAGYFPLRLRVDGELPFAFAAARSVVDTNGLHLYLSTFLNSRRIGDHKYFPWLAVRAC